MDFKELLFLLLLLLYYIIIIKKSTLIPVKCPTNKNLLIFEI